VRVTVINDSLGRDADVSVRLRPRSRAAVAGLESLGAPAGAAATTKVTLGGRTVSPAGTIGAPKPAAIVRSHGGFEVDVPKGSVALLTLSPSRRWSGCAGTLLPPRYASGPLLPPRHASGPCGQLLAASARGRSPATSSHGRVLTTASAPSHARRAVAMP
jgi:hypothetical protein